MIKHSPKILASEEKATKASTTTSTTTIDGLFFAEKVHKKERRKCTKL